VPLSTHDLAALEPLRARFAGHPIALPSGDCIALCEDKPRFNAVLIERGFGAHVPAMQGPFAFPYIVKKRRAEWGEHCHVVARPDDERRYAAQLADPDYFRQAFVPGATEFTTHVLVRGGRLVRALTLEFSFAHALPVKSRDCQPVAIRLRRTAHDRLFEAMLRAIGFEGLGCFNYKLVAGQPQVFEFNPRFGASLAPYFPTFLRSLPKPGG
jgi:carbamoylphosphate synthase large subunit